MKGVESDAGVWEDLWLPEWRKRGGKSVGRLGSGVG